MSMGRCSSGCDQCHGNRLGLVLRYLLFAVVLGCKLIPFPCPWGGAARGVINVTAIAWVLSYAPRIHDPKEYYYPVLALLLAVAGPVLFFSFTRMPTLRLTLTQGRHALLQLAIGFALAILISYFATFSWSEHRENYFESAIVLGAAAAEKETDSTSASAELAKSIVTDFETSGSAVVGVVGKRLLIADDELVGTVLDCPEPLLNPWNCGLVRIERKRKQSRPHTEQPRLAAVQDIEGLASDRSNTVFLVGSHEGKGGEHRPDREFLIRAEWDDEKRELEWKWIYEGLAKDFQKVLQDVGEKFPLDKTTIHEEFNIEGLAYRLLSDSEGMLYVGLRAPLTPDGKAVILSYRLNLEASQFHPGNLNRTMSTWRDWVFVVLIGTHKRNAFSSSRREAPTRPRGCPNPGSLNTTSRPQNLGCSSTSLAAAENQKQSHGRLAGH